MEILQQPKTKDDQLERPDYIERGELPPEESIRLLRLLEILIKIDRRLKSNGNNNQ